MGGAIEIRQRFWIDVKAAHLGAREALMSNPHLRNGLNVHAGKVTYKPVAEELGYDFVPADEALIQ